jgi:catechol 2,3-dioxygenase-like lactoylglutathione lyase family enzyme
VTPRGILETALYADDLDKAEVFYSTVLELELDSKEDGRHLFFKCGEGMLLIFDPQISADQTGHVPHHGAIGPGHVAFSVDPRDLDAWVEQIESRDVKVEARIDWPAGGRSVYFRDPAGNSLELATPQIWRLGVPA